MRAQLASHAVGWKYVSGKPEIPVPLNRRRPYLQGFRMSLRVIYFPCKHWLRPLPNVESTNTKKTLQRTRTRTACFHDFLKSLHKWFVEGYTNVYSLPIVVVRNLWKNAKSKVRALHVDHDALLPLHKVVTAQAINIWSKTEEKNRYPNVLSLPFAIYIHFPFPAFSQDNPSIPYYFVPYKTWISQRCATIVWEQKGILITLWQKTFQIQIHAMPMLLREWKLWAKFPFPSIKAMRHRGSLFHCFCAQLKLLQVQVA